MESKKKKSQKKNCNIEANDLGESKLSETSAKPPGYIHCIFTGDTLEIRDYTHNDEDKKILAFLKGMGLKVETNEIFGGSWCG